MSNHTLETPTEPEAGVWTTGPDGELIPDYDGTFPTINEGEVVHGTVVRVDKDEVLVDIGYKSEGVIPVAELSIRRNVNPADEVTVGDEIDALVMTKEDAEGRLLLSKKRARFELAWKAIEGAAESGEPVNGRVIEVVKGGLILDLGVRGFLPASLVDIRRVQDLDEFLGKELRCKVIELNRSRNNVVLSRRAVLEDERKEMRQAILDRLNPGDVVEGTISNIVDFGAFVDLEGMDGLIHISELSWSHVNHPSEVLEIGQTVNVKVLDIDRERQRISLGLKQTQSDPWQQVLDHYGEGDVVEGRVTKVVTFGAFVEILPGVEGLVHISELANHHVENPREVVSQGDPVNVLDARDRRRPSPALALAQAGRGGGRAGAARRRRRVGAFDARPSALGGGVPLERHDRRGRRGRARLRGRDRRRCAGRRGGRARPRRLSSPEPEPEPEPRGRGRDPGAGRAGARAGARDGRRRSRREPEADGRLSCAARSRSRSRGESAPASRRRSRRSARTARRPSPATRSSTICSPPTTSVREAIVARLGEGVLGADGRPDRGSVARAVFGDPEQLAWLEGLLHPLVSREYLTWREQLAALDDPPRVCVTEVPLLYEVGAEERFDKVVVITAPTALREQRRRVARDDRDARLLPDREKVRRSDFHYVNTGSFEELFAWVGDVMAQLEAQAGASAPA